MAPKKVDEPEKKPLIGRVGTNLKVGIVGIPNVGKSTFFNVLTKSQAAAENFPFCTIDPNENKPVNGDEKYTMNKSVITKRKYLHRVKGYPRLATSSSCPQPKTTWCPRANIYYAFNEDTNPFTRVSGFSETVCSCSQSESTQLHYPPPSNPFTERDPYSEAAARTKELTTAPVCFVIFGKPDLNSKKLAKFIAEYWNCVLISPEILLSEEIDAKTDKGRWIKQVLRSGRSIGPEIVMNLVDSRLVGRDVMHRGYVVEGIPLIPNDPDLDYTAYPDESSVRNPYTVEKMPSFVRTEVDQGKSDSEEDSQTGVYEDEIEEIDEIAGEELPEHEESYGSDGSRSYDLARNPFATESLRMQLRDDYQWDIGNQVRDMFNAWPLKPTVIIHITCPDPDVVHRRSQFRLDPHTGNTVDIGLLEMGMDRHVSSSKLNTEPDDFEFIELNEEIANEESVVDEDLKKHLLTRVADMRSNVEVQCRIFERYVLPCVDERVLMHNPQNVIRVDGRTSVTRMFQVVRERLRTLPLPRVILPKKMSGEDDAFIGGEESPSSSVEDDFGGTKNEETFQDLTSKSVAAPRFRWRLSQWKFTCPVALAKGQKIEGSIRHAVRFMNKLYFMSSSAAVETFVENPRPFLLPPNPRPVCKVFVYGPKYSGKSNLAEFLVHTYGGKVLNPEIIENREIAYWRNVLIRDAIDEILDDVIDEVKEDLENQREEREMARITALKTWHTEAQVVADKLIRISGNITTDKKGDEDHKDSDEIEQRLEEIRDEIELYNLTSLCTDRDLCDRILQDKNILMDFAPEELLTMEAPVGQLDEHDPEVAAILMKQTEEVRQTSIELSNDDISKLVAANIKAAQTAPNSFGFKESGWVVDGMYPDVDLLEKILERGVKVEEVVVIHESEPYDYLIKKWVQNYRDNLVKEAVDEGEEEYDEEEMIYQNVSESNDFQDREDNLEAVLSKSLTAMDLETAELNKYIDELKQFEENRKRIVEKVEEINASLIDVELSDNVNVESYVEQRIENRYRLGATVMTDEDKDREAEDANTSLADEEFGEEEEEMTRELPPSRDNRQLGDTGVFCPIALLGRHVLWKGREEFSAFFMDKLYLLSSQAALDQFLHNPYEFLPRKKPLESIPSLRVAIVGPFGSGKTTLAIAISKEYGLAHIDFPGRLDQYLKDRSIPLVGKKHEDVFAVDDEGLPPPNEFEEVAELPGDLEDQRYNSDRATIQAFVRKYLKEGAALPRRMLKECLTDFFQPPYSSIGLVFDNFPASSYDADAACDNFAVPELVVELVCSVEETQARITPKLYNTWKEKQDEKKCEKELRFATETRKVAQRREKWILKKMKELRRRRVQLLISAEDDEEDQKEENKRLENQNDITDEESSVESDSLRKTNSAVEYNISSDSSTGEPDGEAEIDRLELQEESLMRYKDPVKFEDWEDSDAARERIRQEVDEAYESSSQNLATAREIFEEQSIPWIEIDAERNEDSVLISVLKILDPYVFRNSSALEHVQEVDVDTAERLLDCGYYLLSSFGRSCPVQMYENKVPFQMFLPAETARQIHPVLHREYVYFLVGKERLAAFLEHPLKYLDQDSCTPLIPARIAIIGPPKCGKSTIANRFARTYGMKVVTRGQALRHMLRNFSWTELAVLTSSHLQGGHTALDESIARAVELHSIDPRSVTQGYILDGFPESQSEAEELAFLGIQPMIVIDLRADLDFCLKCLFTDSETLMKPPSYSPCYLSHRYEEWEVDAENFRSWLSKYAQNVVAVDATAQKFAVWTRANDQVCRRFAQIKKYFRETDYDKAQSLTFMCVSPYEFRERQSKFESYCPVCLSSNNVLTLSGTPPRHDGMVQFRNHYYWVCETHLNRFLADPLTILSSTNDVPLPEDRPEIVDQEIDVNHACWAKRLKICGLCPVTYLDNLPRRKIIQGLNTLGVMFRRDLYLFCSPECRNKFVSQPTTYADVEINFTHNLPPVKIKSLPNLGFLEQTVAGLIVRAVNRVSGLRVKLPGMTPAVAAAVYIGVYLKIHNIESRLNEVAVYEEVMRRMDARRHLLEVALRNAKKMINPHVSFPPEERTVNRRIRARPQTPYSSFTSVESSPDSSTQYFTLDEYTHASSHGQSFV